VRRFSTPAVAAQTRSSASTVSETPGTRYRSASWAGLSVRSVRNIERARTRYPRRRSVELLGTALDLPAADLADLLAAAEQAWVSIQRSRPPHPVPAGTCSVCGARRPVTTD
jgi:hypothetical protein